MTFINAIKVFFADSALQSVTKRNKMLQAAKEGYERLNVAGETGNTLN